MKDFLKYVLATVTGIILLTVIMGILATISMVGIAASSASSTKVEENSVFTLMLCRRESTQYAEWSDQ